MSRMLPDAMLRRFLEPFMGIELTRAQGDAAKEMIETRVRGLRESPKRPVEAIRERLEGAQRALEFIPTLRGVCNAKTPSHDEVKGLIKGLEFALRALGVEA